MKTTLILSALMMLELTAGSQPYIDLVNFRYTASPGFISSSAKTILNYGNASLNVPLKLRNGDIIILSPFFEKWETEVESRQPNQSYYGLALPVSYLKKFAGSDVSLVMSPIVRMNDQRIDKNGKLQFGSAVLVIWKKNETLSWKFGLYANGEFFGLFMIPLAGIDWKINDRSNLFGVLPANLTYERKWNKLFYYGLTFRTFTNSYAKDTGYWRVDENQIGAFIDFYIMKKLVLNGEMGSSILRKIRTGITRKTNDNWNANDNVYMKISLAYRMRFR